jgi:hypothetical protein
MKNASYLNCLTAACETDFLTNTLVNMETAAKSGAGYYDIHFNPASSPYSQDAFDKMLTILEARGFDIEKKLDGNDLPSPKIWHVIRWV